MNEQTLVIANNRGQPLRLDLYMVASLPEYSRSRIQTLIKEGNVLVDDEIEQKPGFVLKVGSQVVIKIPPVKPTTLVPEHIPLDILFENPDVLVVNKPAGMVVHPSAGHDSGTLVHAALGHSPEMAGIGGEHRPGVVHRLDKNTSGIILLAKNDFTHRFLQDQFRNRETRKSYLALVKGKPPMQSGSVHLPIGRDPKKRKRMAVVPDHLGRDAITNYRIQETYEKHTLLDVYPVTGRTHQIRVHMAYLKCPVVGDHLYGGKCPDIPLKRHFLHAAQLTIRIPGETDPRVFSAGLPDELNAILLILRNKS